MTEPHIAPAALVERLEQRPDTAPAVSVFTPSHDPTYLTAAYLSLAAQTFTGWEWVVLLNNGATWTAPSSDPRVVILEGGDVTGVGMAKRLAVAACRAPILVELDHDDLLADRALEAVVDAFSRVPDAGLVYSHSATVDAAGNPIGAGYDPAYGWQYRTATVGGLELTHAVTFEPLPHNVALLWFAPNHLRAFTRAAYDEAGGYDADRAVADDADLMCRLYQLGPFELIDECLYLQRMHDANTQLDPERNAAIQAAILELYDAHIEAMATAWATRQGLDVLTLGDAHLGDVESSSVGVAIARDGELASTPKVDAWVELHRVLAPGGMVLTRTPSALDPAAYADPRAVAFYTDRSFGWLVDASPDDAELEGPPFQISRLVTYTDAGAAASYVEANLIALKGPQPRAGGAVPWR